MRVCVRVHVFFIGGQSFKPISMRFETWVPLISRRVKVKFSRKKSDPLPPKFDYIWLNPIGIHLCQASWISQWSRSISLY